MAEVRSEAAGRDRAVAPATTGRPSVFVDVPARPWPTLSVVMPVFDEATTIRIVLERVLASALVSEVLVVDDGSTDGSAEILDELSDLPRVRLFRHPRNCGKGAALRTAFEHVTSDVVLVQDADLEYDPSDYPRLLEPFVDSAADVVYGSRFKTGEGPPAAMPLHYVGNRLLTFLSNRLTGLRLTDMETCYKAFRRDVLQRLRLRSDRFTIEPEVTAKIARIPGVRVLEVPIHYRGRDRAHGKKLRWRDGVAALWAIVRFRLAD